MLFLIMITGWLDPGGFGLWEVILGFITFASYPAAALGFWATRDIARGKLAGRTVLVLNLLLSLAGITIFLGLSYPSYGTFSASYSPFLLAILLVPLGYLNQAANAVAGGYRPSALGYSLLVSEFGKLGVAYPMLFVFKLGITGVIAAVLAAYAIQAAVTTLLVGRAISEPFSLQTTKRWVVGSWIPAIYSLSGTIAVADTVVAPFATGSTDISGYYQAAYSVGSLVTYASFLSYALYPILLRGESEEAANKTLDFILMFGIPMATGAMVLAPHLLALLSPKYVAPGHDVTVSLVILALSGLVMALSSFLDTTLLGRDKSDMEVGRSFRTYLRSNFALVSFANLAFAVTYVSAVYIDARLGTALGTEMPTIVAVWSVLQLSLAVAIALLKYARLRRQVALRYPTSFVAYVVSSAAMAAVTYSLATLIGGAGSDRLFFGLRLVGCVIAGGAVYFGVLAAIDSRTRGLFAALFRVIGFSV